MIRAELPHETYIELALTYMRWNADGDAIEVLKAAPDYPTVAYMLARLLRNAGRAEESAAQLAKAGAMSPAFVFPFREEEIPLYEWAAVERPDDWKPKYYLGLILWAKGRTQTAKDIFDQCSNVDFGPFFLARAALRRDNPARALADYEKAVEVDPKTWRNWHA
jgi:tetratricopeptide (TPR) repeat protein